MQNAWLSIFVAFLFTPSVFGQRDAPVWEAYLPRFSVYHDTSNGKDAISIDLLFKKNGGPYEHTEHQAYILIYLKQDEEQILKLAGDAELVKKQNEKTGLFLDILIEKKLVFPLDSKVAQINSPDGRTPRFADVTGNPKRPGVDRLAESCFPFKFTFANETLFESAKKLGNFHPDKAMTSGGSIWYEEKFKLMVFVPVNDSNHATKVSPKLRKTHDFAYSMDFNTALLYFRPLPYEFGFKRYREYPLLIYIN